MPYRLQITNENAQQLVDFDLYYNDPDTGELKGGYTLEQGSYDVGNFVWVDTTPEKLDMLLGNTNSSGAVIVLPEGESPPPAGSLTGFVFVEEIGVTDTQPGDETPPMEPPNPVVEVKPLE
jgi:hypothetical protein